MNHQDVMVINETLTNINTNLVSLVGAIESIIELMRDRTIENNYAPYPADGIVIVNNDENKDDSISFRTRKGPDYE